MDRHDFVEVNVETLLQVRLCESCHLNVGLSENQGVMCRRCRLQPADARTRFQKGELAKCWRCDARFRCGSVEKLERRDAFCFDCFRKAADLLNALEYATVLHNRRLGLPEED